MKTFTVLLSNYECVETHNIYIVLLKYICINTPGLCLNINDIDFNLPSANEFTFTYGK